jgi:hypothetical protein
MAAAAPLARACCKACGSSSSRNSPKGRSCVSAFARRGRSNAAANPAAPKIASPAIQIGKLEWFRAGMLIFPSAQRQSAVKVA